MRRRLSLVPQALSEETISALEAMLEEARAGRIVGLAWVAIYQGGDYGVGFSGAAKHDPTRAKGMVCRLCNALAKEENSRDD